MSRRFIAIIAIVGTLAISFWVTDAFATWYGHGGNYHGRYGGRVYVGRGPWVRSWGGYYVLPYVGYPYAHPDSYYPGYIPENLTYCDPNSGTYIGEDGARHLCR